MLKTWTLPVALAAGAIATRHATGAEPEDFTAMMARMSQATSQPGMQRITSI